MAYVHTVPALNYSDFVHKFGQNPDVDIGTEDVIAVGGSQYWPAAGVAGASINITSDSANDDGNPAGTGANTLTIEGLDADGYLQTETVTLEGASNANPTGTYLRIFRAFVATAGSGLTNAGNITIADGSGTFAYIPAGAGQTLQTSYTVPMDYQMAYMTSWYLTVGGSVTTNIDGVLKARPNGGAWRDKEYANLAQGSAYHYVFDHPIAYAPLTDLVIEATSTANNSVVSGGFDLTLV